MSNFWEIQDWEATDYHLKKVREMPFQRKFPFIPKDPGLYIIRGPRQIGKSSWLKAVLSHYAKNEKCFYLSCENISDNKELAEILASIRGTQIILLDEVSFIKDWDRAIKHEIDSGHIQILMVTDSHAHDLKRGSDLMPGRFGAGGEYNLLPMNFDEFYEARLESGWATGDRIKELEVYFQVGGFPMAIAEAGPEGNKPKKSMDTYWKWLVGDAKKLGKNSQYLEEILIQLALCLQTPLSFQTLAKKTTIGSHNTVRAYIEFLESCFALRELHAIDLDTGALRFKKDRKFYFTDPLIFWIAQERSGRSAPTNAFEKMSEMVAHEFLAREHLRFGYFSNKNGEIDFILPGEWAIEVKWAEYASNLSKAYLKLPLINKKVWTKPNFLL